MEISQCSVWAKFSLTLLLAATHVLCHAAAQAKPVVEFDLRKTVECRDLTPPDFAQQHPGERIVECKFRLSVYLAAGTIEEIEAIRVEIGDHDERITVFSFSPGTRLESEYSGEIQTTRTRESSRTLAASLGGEMPAGIGGGVANVAPSINGAAGGKEIVTETSRRIAPMQVVVASGTINNEHGVFFTLRPSPVSSLEGLHELTVQFVVPADWRGGEVHVSCRATGDQKLLWMKRQKQWAQKSEVVALYLRNAAATQVADTRL